MIRRTTLALALGAAIAFTAAAAPARAQQFPTQDPSYTTPDPSLAPPEGFGAPGTIAITSDFDIDLRRISQSFRGSSVSETQIHVTPTVLMFMAHNFAIGGILAYQYDAIEEPTDYSLTKLGIGPLAAYNIGVSPRVSLLPTAGLLYTWAKQNETVNGGRQSASGYEVSLLLRVPVLFHPFPHAFVGATPFTEIDLVSKSEGQDVAKTRTFGVTLDLGLWF
jgi:hypothetical protein